MSVKFHFLNVGDGDCTIIDFPKRFLASDPTKEFPPRIMMVDVHHHDDHDDYEHITDYYRKNFKDEYGNVRPIFRYVLTHPHKDHIKGMSTIFEEIPVHNFWDVDHEFQPNKTGGDWEEYKDDWEYYEKIRSGKDVTVLRYTHPTNPLPFWDDDRIEVLTPSKELYDFVHKKEDGTLRTPEDIGNQLNNLSYVLLIRVNDLKILLAGDAESKCWEYILKHHKDKIKDIDILKAAHHGRDSGFHEEAVKIMNPKHIIFSASEDCEHTVPEKYKNAAPRGVVHNTGNLGSFILDCDFAGNISLNKYE